MEQRCWQVCIQLLFTPYSHTPTPAILEKKAHERLSQCKIPQLAHKNVDNRLPNYGIRFKISLK
jgi:hypothetical protein